jgi:hypothetical protein
MRHLALAVILALGCISTAEAAGGAADVHLNAATGALFRQSVFAHFHGYEDGLLHAGDLDLQSGRRTHALDSYKEFRSAKNGYDSSFGDRKRFEDGYREGFRAGYSDAVLCREPPPAVSTSAFTTATR